MGSITVRVAIALLLVVTCSCGGGSTDTPASGEQQIFVTLSAATSVATNTTQVVTAVVSGDASQRGVNWSLSGAGCSGAQCGTLSNETPQSVTYIPPTSVPDPPVVTVTATSIADPSRSRSVSMTVYIKGSILVTVSPSTAAVDLGKTVIFIATLTGDRTNAGVSWQLGTCPNLGQCGSITPGATKSGEPATYKAPGSALGSFQVTIKAVSMIDADASATATIQVRCVGGGCFP